MNNLLQFLPPKEYLPFILGLTFLLFWKASTWKASMENRLSKEENSLGDLSAKVGKMETVPGKVAALDAKVDSLADKVDMLCNGVFLYLKNGVEQSKSPTSWSTYGEQLSEKIDAGAVAAIYVERLHRLTTAMNAYQVQERCFAFCDHELMDDLEKTDRVLFDKISMTAYQNGIRMNNLTRVVGLHLRDKVLMMSGQLAHVHTPADTHADTHAEAPTSAEISAEIATHIGLAPRHKPSAA